MGLPQAHRLKHYRDFQAVYRHGSRYTSPHLILRALPESGQSTSPDTASTRIGISISQKVSNKAVIRNRIKRQIRGVIRELLPCLLPGWRVVVVVRSGAGECKYEHFLRELNQLLVTAEIVNGHSRKYVL